MSESRWFVEGREVWLLKHSAGGAWVCSVPEDEDAGDCPGDATWVELNDIEDRGPTPLVDPDVYGHAALKSMAESVLYCLGGPEGAARQLSRDHYTTLCVCAAFMVEEKS